MSAESNSGQATLANNRVRELVKETCGLEITATEADWICSVAAGRKGIAISKQYDKLVGVIGQVLSNHIGVGWTGTSHTADYTVLTALGPGSDRFAGLIRNTDAFTRLCELMEIKHRNPTMSAERARELRAAAPAVPADETHWT